MPLPPTQMTQDSAHKALLWVVATAFFMQALDTTIVNTALPSIARSLHASALAMQPVIVGYTLTMAILTPASGWLADRFGTRRVYLAAILIFVRQLIRRPSFGRSSLGHGVRRSARWSAARLR